MADNNRLELDLIVKDDSAAGAQSFNRNLKSMEEQAVSSAGKIDKELQRITASTQRSVDAYVNRASMAGMSPLEKIYAREAQLLSKIGDDTSLAAERVRAGTKNLVAAYNDRDRQVQAAAKATETRRQGTEAGRAIMAGEAEFQSALARMQTNNAAITKLQADRERALDTPTQRVARDRADFSARYGGSSTQREAIEREFAQRMRLAKQQEFDAAGIAAGKATLSGEAEFQAALEKMQSNNAGIAKLQADRQRSIESPTQRVQREKADALARFGGTPSQRSTIDQEFAARLQTARDQETRTAGLAAGKAKLPGEAEFQAAFKKVQERDQMMDDLELRASLAGKKTSERLAMEGQRVVSGLSGTPKLAQEAETHYKTIVDAAKKAEAEATGGHTAGGQALRRGVLAGKDLLEGSTRGFWIELTDIFVGTSGSGGILPSIASGLTSITGLSSGAIFAVGGLTAAFAGLGVVGLMSARHLAETGQQIKDFSERTGIRPENVQHFQFAAKAEGVNPEVFQHAFRSLAQATDEDSTSGARVRKELKDLNVDMYDQATGQLRPTENIMLDLASAIQKLPPGLQQSAASLEIFKRSGDGLLPVMLHLNENFEESKRIGGTYGGDDLHMFDEWHHQIVKLDTEWQRFEAKALTPLAKDVTLTLNVITRWLTSGGEVKPGDPHSTADLFNPVMSGLRALGVIDPLDSLVPGEPTPAKVGPSESRKAHADQIAFQRQKADFAAFDADLMKDPDERLRRAQKELAALEVPTDAKKQGPEVLKNYKAALDKVKAAKDATGRGGGGSNRETDRALQGVIAARNEGLRLDTEYAKQQFAEAEQLSRVELDSKNELSTPEQTKGRLDAAFWVAQYQTNEAIESRRKMIDTKTGREVDLSNTQGFKDSSRVEVEENLPKRIRDEQFKVLMEMAVNDTKYFKNRTDEEMKHQAEAWQRRQAGELELQDKIISLQNQVQERRLQIDIDANDRQKGIALESLGSVNAQTLKDKMALEDQKFAIEKDYADRGLVLQLQRLTTQRALAVGEIEKDAREHGINPDTDENSQKLIQLTKDKYDQDADVLRQTVADKEVSDAMRTAKAKEDLQIQSNRKIYDSLKQDAAGLFDQLVSHTKSWADFAKDLFKSAILTPVKDIFSSQVAGLFTGLITGNKVTFDPVGTGEGKLGGIEGALGRAGLGQPHFNIPHSTALVTSKLEQANHIGDLGLVGGAVPVVIMNSGGGSTSVGSSVGSGLANSFGSFILNGARSFQRLAPRETVQSSWSPIMSGATGVSPSGFPTMGEISSLGTPEGIFSAATSDNPWAIPTAPPFVDPSLSGVQLADWANPNLGPEAAIAQPASQGGIFSRIGQMFGLGGGNVKGTPPFLPDGASGGGASGGGGLFGGLKSMFGLDTAGTDMGGGVGIARSGFGGNLAAITKSSGFALAGGIAAMDGIRRGGVLGTLEATAGGAAVGFKFGGFLGAGIGAAIGGGLALAKTFGLFGGDEKHAKDLVKQVYGVDINDATAKSIVAIAKQSFGGQIDVAVRSPQVRELLKLYSQATGQKKAEDMFVQDSVHNASFSEVNGKLTQNAIYENGNAYAYSSRLATNGGVQTSPLSTYQPNQGVFAGTLQLNLNGQAASDVLRGQVTSVANPQYVQSQSLNASKASYGRTAQQNMALSPSALAQ